MKEENDDPQDVKMGETNRVGRRVGGGSERQSGRNDSGPTGKWLKRPWFLWHQATVDLRIFDGFEAHNFFFHFTKSPEKSLFWPPYLSPANQSMEPMLSTQFSPALRTTHFAQIKCLEWFIYHIFGYQQCPFQDVYQILSVEGPHLNRKLGPDAFRHSLAAVAVSFFVFFGTEAVCLLCFKSLTSCWTLIFSQTVSLLCTMCGRIKNSDSLPPRLFACYYFALQCIQHLFFATKVVCPPDNIQYLQYLNSLSQRQQRWVSQLGRMQGQKSGWKSGELS